MLLAADILPSTAPRRPVCTSSSHAAAKATPSIWATFIPCGVMRIDGDDEEPGYELHMANCPLCFSTLAIEVR